ncbi:hypothetical protein HK407_12g18690 [Ordospora pajunii]|uniref:uncharacterized protein n=1 Tax=Ordospora pajunii TaxID=3039483 RepID=UPI0029529275|nr:uncharacterized protein HK407_12g18690 [Ordospora pajunii]KAH9410737.1 hypothetical protein HK407_12g18690 [Ordospora pajunii]
MEQFNKIAIECISLFKKNLLFEYQSNKQLANAFQAIQQSIVESKVRMCNSSILNPALKLGKAMNGLMNISDACILIGFDICNPLRYNIIRLPNSQTDLQKKLDELFTIPQYYGGLRHHKYTISKYSINDCYKQKLPIVYIASIGKSFSNLISRSVSFIKRIFSIDPNIFEIEECIIPKVFTSISSRSLLSELCTENGCIDLENIVKEITKDHPELMSIKTTDIRRTETTQISSNSFSSQFEVEFETVNKLNNQLTKHILLAQANFIPASKDTGFKWTFAGLVWAKLN